MAESQRHRFPPYLALLPLWVGAQVAAGAEPILPTQLGEAQRTEVVRVQPTELEEVAGEQADILREYGSGYAERARYQRGEAGWLVTAHRMQDRSGAYGAFTLFRKAGNPVLVGEAGVRTSDGIAFYQGNYFVVAQPQARASDLVPLAEHLARIAGPQASLPPLPRYLPREGFLAGSDRYLLGPLALASVAPMAEGDWVGFAYGAEAVIARYQIDGGTATLFLLSYPTPQIAIERLRSFERLFNLNGTGHPSRPLAHARRSSSLVVLATGVSSSQAATHLIDRVRFETKLSWSEPGEAPPQFNWGRTLLNLFIGTGLMVLVTLVLGVAFAAARLLAKRLFPGHVFDRPEDTDIIRLDLGGRR